VIPIFHVSSREEVDRVHARVTAAGHRSHKAPEDAFWGARYAIIEDPDGNPEGIMSPIDESKRRPSPPRPRTRRARPECILKAMESVYQEFSRELAAWQAELKGRPEEEERRLWLLALEREQLVSVAYAEDRLRSRLESLPGEVRRLARAALAWVWRDEEMHAVYIRGALLRLPGAHAGTRLTQAGGAVAGWASTVLQHAPPKRARMARAVATVVTWLGILGGKVPRSMRDKLGYRSFRDFCELNIETEKTAAACWDRLVELGRGDAAAYARIRDDERSHAALFEALRDSLDDAALLEKRLRAIGPAYAPSRDGASVVTCLRGDDKRALLAQALEDLPGVAGRKVAIKVSFALGYSRRDLSPVADAELLAALARALRERGATDVAVLEAPNIYDRFYANRGVAEIARYFGLGSPDYRIVDASADQVAHSFARGLGQSSVSKTWRDADLRISFTKLRSHACSYVHCAIGNLEGLGARTDEYLFPERFADRDTATLMLLEDFPIHFALLDAFENIPDGLMGTMGCPRPRRPQRLYASRDALALDLVAARHVGDRGDRSRLLAAALHWFGERPIEVRGLDAPIEPWRGPYATSLGSFLSLLSFPVYSFGSARGAIFVPQMDEEAFPPLSRAGFLRRAARGATQALLDLRLPA
jgi:uncharacterized protein (DUF362 family)